MKLSTYLKSIFPGPAIIASFFALPLVLTMYFVVTQYSDRFILEQNVSYFDVQSNWLGQFILDQKWLDWFNRFMDFAFWGIGALIVLVGLWAISSAKVSFKNHYAQEDFKNFSASKSSWHSKFFIVLLLKIVLVVLFTYSILAIVGKLIPQLSLTVSGALQEVSWATIYPVLLVCLGIIAYQFLLVTSIKLFKHLRAE
jgi:hypothetical protein